MSIPRIAVILILYTPFPSKGGANRTKKQRLSFQSAAAQQKGSAEAHLRPTPILHKKPFKVRKAAAPADRIVKAEKPDTHRNSVYKSAYFFHTFERYSANSSSFVTSE